MLAGPMLRRHTLTSNRSTLQIRSEFMLTVKPFVLDENRSRVSERLRKSTFYLIALG
jgi:hypothetical protein